MTRRRRPERLESRAFSAEGTADVDGSKGVKTWHAGEIEIRAIWLNYGM